MPGKRIDFSNLWVRNGLLLIVFSVLVNHLTLPEHFPLNESYEFPWFSILVSIFLGGLFMIIIDANFHYYKRNHFTERITTRVLLRFFLTTYGYITVIYVLLFYLLNGVDNPNLYYLLTGYSVTVLICTLAILLSYARAVYELYRGTSIEGKLKVAHSGKITLVGYDEIAFVYSENKIAYIVKTDGSLVATDFTLNEIEEKITAHPFYRANRQTILHAYSIEQVLPIENGKLSVHLKPALSESKARQVTISRYKKQEFLDWFENKS